MTTINHLWFQSLDIVNVRSNAKVTQHLFLRLMQHKIFMRPLLGDLPFTLLCKANPLSSLQLSSK